MINLFHEITKEITVYVPVNEILNRLDKITDNMRWQFLQNKNQNATILYINRKKGCENFIWR